MTNISIDRSVNLEATTAEIQAVAAEFDAVAPDYQSTVEESIRFTGKGLEFFTQAKVDHLVDLGARHLGGLGGRRVLDIGCGNGITDSLLASAVGELHGVDTSPEMVARAERRNPTGIYECYDGLRLPYADAAFDVSFTICVMHHVPPAVWDGFSREMLRVTRPGGIVVVFEHNPLNPLTRRAVARCPFDAEAVLRSVRGTAHGLHQAGAQVLTRRFILFLPAGGRRTRQLEKLIGWLPLGAQYVVAARRPAHWGEAR